MPETGLELTCAWLARIAVGSHTVIKKAMALITFLRWGEGGWWAPLPSGRSAAERTGGRPHRRGEGRGEGDGDRGHSPAPPSGRSGHLLPAGAKERRPHRACNSSLKGTSSLALKLERVPILPLRLGGRNLLDGATPIMQAATQRCQDNRDLRHPHQVFSAVFPRIADEGED
jgi:hypothetical protein